MLYRRKNSRFWWCAVQVNGKRRWFSTETESQSDAMMIASAIKARLKGGSRERFNRIVDAIVGDNEGEVGLLLSRLPSEYPTLLKQEGRVYGEKELGDRVSRLGRLAEFFYGRLSTVSAITSALAWEFISSLSCSAKSKRNIAGQFSSIWGTLIKFGFATENPWKSARPQRNAKEEKHGRAFTPQEIEAMLAVAPPWIRTEILIGVYTGLRPSDIRKLTWNNVDLRMKTLALVPSKTARHGIAVTVPLHDVLVTHLTSIFKLRGKIVEASAHPDRDWKTLLDTCGIKAGQGERITSHCLRHTFATWVAKAGASKEEMMKLGGWAVDKTVDIYNHHEDVESLATLIERMPSVK